jgi:uncharacterized protein YraI
VKPAELVVMASLGCSPAQAVSELARWEPALINLAHLHPVAGGIVRATTLNVRAMPDTNAPALGKLAQDTAVEVWGRSADGRWLVIGEPAGWVAAEWVTLQG